MIYRCNNCGYESNKYFGLCPKCKQGEGEEISEILVKKVGGLSNKTERKTTNVQERIRKVDPNVEVLKAERITQYPNFNNVLSSAKGFVNAQVVLLGAIPGVGKSTLCSALASEDTLYISSEENYSQVNSRMLRVNPKSGCDILSSTDFDEIYEAIQTTSKKLIVIDSINSIGFASYAVTAKYAIELTTLAKDLDKIVIMISQVSRNGEIIGMQSIIHAVDTVLHLERSETSNNIILTSSKNRFGEIGEVAMFRHESNGFTEIETENSDSKADIGTCYTETKFGRKKLTIAIESLTTTAQAAYGLRTINGYNRNRLIQLIGIISYFGNINLTDKDIYVAISNGLSTDDVSIELPMAVSILSSYFKKTVISKAYGDVRLNGRIVNGNIDGKEIYHINELINLYKNK